MSDEMDPATSAYYSLNERQLTLLRDLALLQDMGAIGATVTPLGRDILSVGDMRAATLRAMLNSGQR